MSLRHFSSAALRLSLLVNCRERFRNFGISDATAMALAALSAGSPQQ
jgi:hypothetical protein